MYSSHFPVKDIYCLSYEDRIQNVWNSMVGRPAHGKGVEQRQLDILLENEYQRAIERGELQPRYRSLWVHDATYVMVEFKIEEQS